MKRYTLLLSLLCTTACVTESIERDTRPTSFEGFDVSRQWTQPVLFHGVPVQFELLEGEESKMLLPTAGHDLIGVYGDHPRGVEHRFASFYVQGRRCGSTGGDVGPLMVHRPAQDGEPWRRSLDGFDLIWHAEPGVCAVEQRIGDKLVWTLVGATVSLETNGRVEITYGRHAHAEREALPEGEVVEWDLSELPKKGNDRKELREVLRCPVRITLGPHGNRIR